jgi:hypothetical protein
MSVHHINSPVNGDDVKDVFILLLNCTWVVLRAMVFMNQLINMPVLLNLYVTYNLFVIGN